MGYRVDNIPDYAARANQRLYVIAARGGDGEAFFERVKAGDAEAAERLREVTAKYGIAVALEEAQKDGVVGSFIYG